MLSIANVADFQVDPMGGVIAGMLVDGVPQSEEAQAALRAKVLSREHIRGSLVSDDGTAVVLVAFAAYRADPQQVAGDIERIVLEELRPTRSTGAVRSSRPTSSRRLKPTWLA